MAVFGRVSAVLAPRDLIDEALFRWQTCWRIGPENLAGMRFVRAFERAGDMISVDQSSAQFPHYVHIQYTGFCRIR